MHSVNTEIFMLHAEPQTEHGQNTAIYTVVLYSSLTPSTISYYYQVLLVMSV